MAKQNKSTGLIPHLHASPLGTALKSSNEPEENFASCIYSWGGATVRAQRAKEVIVGLHGEPCHELVIATVEGEKALHKKGHVFHLAAQDQGLIGVQKNATLVN
jgi:hypothetical protein